MISLCVALGIMLGSYRAQTKKDTIVNLLILLLFDSITFYIAYSIGVSQCS